MGQADSTRFASTTELTAEPPAAFFSLPAGRSSLKAPAMGEMRLPRSLDCLPCVNTALRSDFVGLLQAWNARLREHQRCIRILDAVRWNGDIEADFFARAAGELPDITADDYRQAVPLERIRDRLLDLRRIERDINARLGTQHAAGRLLLRRCRSAQDALRLIAARGTGEFVWLSREVFGSTLESKTNRDRLTRLISWLEASPPAAGNERRYDADFTAGELERRLNAHFAPETIRVVIADTLNADACAGSGYLKVRRDARFTAGDIDLLEAHEGWAHVGTMLSGRGQPVFGVLAGCAPCVTCTQEGLAVFTEILADACNPARRRRLANRMRAVMMAERGADFLDVFRFFQERGSDDRNAYRNSVRVFRGSLPTGHGPFTKDYSYGLGLIELSSYLRSHPDDDQLIPLLFSGKTCFDDLPDLAELHGEGLLIAGEYVPPPFKDRARIRQGLRELATA